MGCDEMRCPICKTSKQILEYRKDNPLLECGHLVTLEIMQKHDQNYLLIREAILTSIRFDMVDKNISHREAQKSFFKDWPDARAWDNDHLPNSDETG